MPTDPKKRSAVDDEDTPQEIRQPIQRPHSRKSNLIPWLAAGGCGVLVLLSCVLCGGFWTWYQHSRLAIRSVALTLIFGGSLLAQTPATGTTRCQEKTLTGKLD